MLKSRSSQTTPPLPIWRPRRTLIDLYNEKDQTAWYWRTVAMIAAFLISIGFLVFPTAFSNTSNLAVPGRAAGVTAAILLAFGYTLSMALWLMVSSWVFQLEVIFVPCLSSSLFGLFNVVYSLSTHKTPNGQSQWNTASMTALVLATLSSLAYTVLTLLTSRKIHIVRVRDGTLRYRSNSDTATLLPEDEMQRRQLLHLLSQKDSRKPSPAASQNTFRIDLPDTVGRQPSHLVPPQNAYGGSREHSRGRSFGEMPRSDDQESWRLGNGSGNTAPQQPTQPHEGGGLYISQPDISTRAAPEIHSQMTPAHNFPSYPNHHTPPSNQAYAHHTRQSSDSTTSSHDDLDHRYPPEKPAFRAHHRPRHPLERELSHEQRVAALDTDQPPQPRRVSNKGRRNEYFIVPPEEAEEIIQRNSRESRRTEIELRDQPAQRQELEGVEVVTRIKRVETDGWGRKIMGG